MQHPPKYQTPGSRSAAEGSGVTNSIPAIAPGAGQLTPPGLVSYPGGSPDVSYRDGAGFTAKGGPIKGGGASVSMTPLSYKE